MMKLFKIKHCEISYSELPDEIRKSFSIRLLGSVILILTSLVYSIYSKKIIVFAGITSIILAYIVTIFHQLLIYMRDEALYIEGKVKKIVNKRRFHKKYKDVYIETDDNQKLEISDNENIDKKYFIIVTAGSKNKYEIGTRLRVYFTEDVLANKGTNIFKINNPMLIAITGADYEESETDEEVANKRRRKR